MSKAHVSGDVQERIYPKIYHYAYFSLSRIKKHMERFARSLDKTDYKILDVGCGNKPYVSVFSGYSEYIGTDIVPGDMVDIVCDSAHLPFEDNYFDYVVCNQTLEHTREIDEAICEMKRVLKKDGFALISVPFLFPEHACPWDYYRFTRFGLQEKFKDFEVVSIKNDTGYFTTIALFINMMFTYGKTSRILFAPLFLIINILAGFLEFFLINVLYELFSLRKVKLIEYAIEGQYKQFTANYIMVVKNSKK